MKIRKDVTINADREKVWRIFDNPEYSRKWQPTLKSRRLLSGLPEEAGAQYELIYDHKGRDMRVVATLTEKQEFEIWSADLDSDWSLTTIRNRFEPLADGRTRWVFETEYRFKGIYKFVAIFFRKALLGRTDLEMQRFKRLVESGLQAD